jgi:hypothetical protein
LWRASWKIFMPLEPLDGRIAVALEGDPIDLNDACSFFPEGESEVQVCRITIPPNEKYVLLANVLNGLKDETEVIRMAGRLIDLVNGVLFLEDPQRLPIVSQRTHYRQAADGSWGVAISIPGVSARGRAGRISFRQAGEPTPQTLVMRKAMNDENVRDVLTYLSSVPDWIDLFKAFELMRADVKDRFGQDGQRQIDWPSGRRIEAFTADAQFLRHSKARWPKRDPNSAMPLHEARLFVQELCRKWLVSI